MSTFRHIKEIMQETDVYQQCQDFWDKKNQMNLPTVPALAELTEINTCCGEARESAHLQAAVSHDKLDADFRGSGQSFHDWLLENGDWYAPPQSFSEWLEQNNDSIEGTQCPTNE